MGVAAGDRVATLMLNSTDTFELQYARPRLGAIFQPVNWRLAVPQLLDILAQSLPRILIYSPDFEQQALALAAAFPALLLAKAEAGATSAYESMVSNVHFVPEPRDLDWNARWTIIYTSGTTGRPKGAIVAPKMVLFNNIHSTTTSRLSANSSCASFLPTFPYRRA